MTKNAKNDFSHVRHWVFDLDNTLYPPSDRLFDQIEVRMTEYVMTALNVELEHANYLRKHYWQKYGTTLTGLMSEHDVDPTPYLTHVHEISMSHMTHAPDLAMNIKALPGRKIVYTNGTGPYAERVLEARGLNGVFDAIYGVEHANFRPKPERSAYETIFALDGTTPDTAAMFEDDPRNLIAPHQLGMKTVHVAAEGIAEDHIHYHTTDLTDFLSQLV
ncbi:pyrimidine 5'-nucleotidase [Falsihalocynthiibacter sp. SS001]|uniref:pyrimidine 5'-nucleotidase n=1 Tax=Falsihalocynthiibacter sp. SS001 TaxID=3349698 RepID=UPI0036D36B85